MTAARSSVNALDRTSSTMAIRVTSPLVRDPRSTMVVISSGGRLSTTNQPRSSRHLAAVDRPAPESPETIATWMPAVCGLRRRLPAASPRASSASLDLSPPVLRLAPSQAPRRDRVADSVDRSGVVLRARRRYRAGLGRRACRCRGSPAVVAAGRGRVAPVRRRRSCGAGAARRRRPPRSAGRCPGTAGDLVDIGLAQRGHRSEVPDQRLPPDVAEPGDVVQRGHRHRLRPLRPVVGDGEPVRLVPQPLQQVQRLAGAREDDRLVLAGHPHLLEPLGQPADRHVDDAELGQHGGGRVDLRRAAVDHQQLRRVGEPAGPAGLRVDARGR